MLGLDNSNLRNFSKSRKSRLKFAGLKIIRDDLNYFISNKKKLFAVIVIAFIPLLYSFLYLDAFWDPYSRLDKMPVAVVNLDNGGNKDGKNVNYGNDLVNKLKDNKKVNWVITNYSDADSGVNGKKYYSMVVIPENFSKTITDSVNGTIEKASISYIPNEKKNFLASQVSSRIMLELKDEVAKNITGEGSKILVDSLYKTKDGFKTAYEGSKELNDGAVKLYDGVSNLNDGASKLYDGSVQLDNKLGELKNGLVQLMGGSKSLFDGLLTFSKESGSGKAQLLSGAKDLSKGAGDMYSGFKEFDTKITDGENKLKSGLKEYDTKITAGENSLKDASGKLSDGLGQLITGFDEYNTKVTDGESQLRSGAKQVSNGLSSLKSGLSEYDSKVTDGENQLLSGAKVLSGGLSTLNGGLKQLDSSLSAVDSSKISALIQGSDALSQGITTTAGAINSLNSSIESQNLINKVMSSNMDQSDKIAVITALSTIQNLNGATGMPALKTGADSIAAGTKQFSSFASVATAVNQLSSGANAAKSGADQLLEGITNFQTQSTKGLSSLQGGVSSLKSGAGELVNGIADFKSKQSEGYKTLYNGAKSIKSGVDQLSAGINEFQTQSSEGRQSLLSGMNDFAVQSTSARKSILSGAEKLSVGSNTIFTGLKEYDSKTSEGINKLISGATELNSGESEALNGVDRIRNEGAAKLKSGLSNLCNGTQTLQNGTQTLQQGTQTLQQGLNDGYNEINSKLNADSDKMSKFLSEPVSLVEKPINHVPEYGSGFTPYFIPLALWVGALLMFLFVPMGVNKKYKNSPGSVVFGKFALLLTIGILQAVITSIVILTVLHLQVQNIALFFGFNILLAAAFISIIQALIFLFGEDAGKFLSLVLLMLQLTSCGGTFPMELVPKFFNVIKPYLPMTYGTSGLREIISGIDYNVLRSDTLILTAFVAGFLTLSVIAKSRVEKIKRKIISSRGKVEEIA